MEISSKSQQIWEFYHEHAHEDPIKSWRAEVPPSARKAWVIGMIHEVGRDKIQQPEFLGIVKKYLTVEDLESFNKSQQKIAGLKQQQLEDDEKAKNNNDDDWGDGYDDTLMEEENDFNYWLETKVTPEMLEEFAKVYFTSFNTESEKRQELWEKEDKIGKLLLPAVGDFLKNRELIDREFKLDEPRGMIKNLIPGKDYVKAIVVAGSAALGPRSENYEKKQDIDLLFLPEKITSGNKEELKEFGLLMEEFNGFLQQFSRSSEGLKIAEKFKDQLAGIVELFDFLLRNNLEIDTHAPFLVNPFLFNETSTDWRKLCGPHRIIETRGDDWREHYQSYLNQSFEDARKSLITWRENLRQSLTEKEPDLSAEETREKLRQWLEYFKKDLSK